MIPTDSKNTAPADLESKFKDNVMRGLDMREDALGSMFQGTNYDPEKGLGELEDALMQAAPLFGVTLEPFKDTGGVSAEAASLVVTINEALNSAGMEPLELTNLNTDSGIAVLAGDILTVIQDRAFLQWLKQPAEKKAPVPVEPVVPETPITPSPMNAQDMMGRLGAMSKR